MAGLIKLLAFPIYAKMSNISQPFASLSSSYVTFCTSQLFNTRYLSTNLDMTDFQFISIEFKMINCYYCCFSGWRRVSPTLKRASTGVRTSSVTWLTTTSTTGCGRRSSSAVRPTASTSKSSSRCATARSSPVRRSRARRRSASSTTSSTPLLASHRRGNPTLTSSSTASLPTRDASLLPTR